MHDLMFDEGVGFPTCNRELDVLPVNTNDPNGFYEYLDLPPWAGLDEIKRRCKRLLRKYHPDGWKSDDVKFRRVEEIYRVLGNPVEKAIYDHTPEGSLFLADSVVMDQLREKAQTAEQLRDLTMATPKLHWSYHVYGPAGDPESDRLLAQQWYDVLLDAAYECGYRGRIQLVLSDVTEAFFEKGGLVSVSRAEPDPMTVEDILSNCHWVSVPHSTIDPEREFVHTTQG